MTDPRLDTWRARDITVHQIAGLLDNARATGDTERVALCELALSPGEPDGWDAAWDACVLAILDAQCLAEGRESVMDEQRRSEATGRL